MEIQMVHREEIGYPACFNDLSKRPSPLYYIGDLALLGKGNCVAVIGKRDAEPASLKNAETYGRLLSEKGYTVVNGIAHGTDQAAIQGVIKAKGKAVLVMPCGLDLAYPASAKTMMTAILKLGGCIISEYDIGVRPQKSYFLQRDRLQAAVADKVLVVEADEQGGTMTTIQHAIKLGKPIACVVGIDGSSSYGGNRKIVDMKQGIGVYDEESMMNFVSEPVAVQMSLIFS